LIFVVMRIRFLARFGHKKGVTFFLTFAGAGYNQQLLHVVDACFGFQEAFLTNFQEGVSL